MALLLRFLPYILGASVLAGAYFWVDGRGYDRGRGELELELVEVKKKHEKEINELQGKINRIGDSIRRRCLTGERLPECKDLGLP